jgi:hypothetical protein
MGARDVSEELVCYSDVFLPCFVQVDIYRIRYTGQRKDEPLYLNQAA